MVGIGARGLVVQVTDARSWRLCARVWSLGHPRQTPWAGDSWVCVMDFEQARNLYWKFSGVVFTDGLLHRWGCVQFWCWILKEYPILVPMGV